ncbi:hypothetical protein ACLB2K_006296 [Fragaria x ananassa]
MVETETNTQPHVVCVPYPSQDHISPLMQLAKRLNSRGFHITFVNTEFNHWRLVRSRGHTSSLSHLPDFRFETIPDGLPPSDKDATQDVPALNGVMDFGREAAVELGITEFQFWTASACGFMGYLHYGELLRRGMAPFKGPLPLLRRHIPTETLKSLNPSLWKEDSKLLEWLDRWEPNSVVYVNYGSVTVMTDQHLKEFAWGLANRKHPFLWVVRLDVVKSDSIMLPDEFLKEVKDRGYIASWATQEQVLGHKSVGVFLTHCGWNSMLETVSEGVPVICWPFFADQQTNCGFACGSWGIGLEVKHDVKRCDIEGVVKDMMEGEKGRRGKS